MSLRREQGSHLWSAGGPSTRGLEKGDTKENSNNPPLVLVDPVEHSTNLVFDSLATEPDGSQTDHDSGNEKSEELLWSHL